MKALRHVYTSRLDMRFLHYVAFWKYLACFGLQGKYFDNICENWMWQIRVNEHGLPVKEVTQTRLSYKDNVQKKNWSSCS